MNVWSANNVHFPPESKDKNRQGDVIMRFVVRPDGSRTDISIIRGIDEYLDAEAIRAVEAMPAWIPATINGKPVPVWYTFKLNFRLLHPMHRSSDDQTVPYTNPFDYNQ